MERKHRHIVETGLSILAHAGLPLKYWNYAFQTVVFIINNPPTSTLNYKTPHAILYKRDSNYNMFRIFGCICYPLLRPYNRNKFDFKSHVCLFLGYSINKKGLFVCILVARYTFLVMFYLMNINFHIKVQLIFLKIPHYHLLFHLTHIHPFYCFLHPRLTLMNPMITTHPLYLKLLTHSFLLLIPSILQIVTPPPLLMITQVIILLYPL